MDSLEHHRDVPPPSAAPAPPAAVRAAAPDPAALPSPVASLLDAPAAAVPAPVAVPAHRGGGTDWRTGPLDREIHSARDELGAVYDTGHHKLAKSKLSGMWDKLDYDQKRELRQRLDLHPGGEARSVMSLGSNVVLGPQSGLREEDPNRAVDPTLDASGEMTPRSRIYSQLDGVLSGHAAPRYDAATFATIAGHLETAERLHYTRTGGRMLDRDVSMWSQEGADGRWVRGRAAAPAAAAAPPPAAAAPPPAAAPRSLRELKRPEFQADTSAGAARMPEEFYSDPYAEVEEDIVTGDYRWASSRQASKKGGKR